MAWDLQQTLSDSSLEVWQVRFSPNSNYLIAASNDGAAYVYETTNWTLEATLSEPTGDVRVCAWKPDESEVAIGGVDDTLRIYETTNWTQDTTISEGDTITGIDYSPDGSELASAVGPIGDSEVNIYDTSNWSNTDTLTDMGSVSQCSYSNDGSLLAAAGNGDDAVYVYATSDYSLSQTLSDPANNAYAVDWDSDDSHLAVGIWAGETLVYETSGWTVDATITRSGDTTDHNDVSFAVDDNYLAIGAASSSVYIQEGTPDFNNVTEITDASSNVYGVDFSPNDNWIAYGSHDNNVYVSDVPSGQTANADVASVQAAAPAVSVSELEWLAADLDSAASSDGVVHESVADTDHSNAAELKQGYSVASPFKSTDLEVYYPLQDNISAENWTAESTNPLFDGHGDPDVIIDSGTYYMYTTGPNSDNCRLYTSSDGISWTYDHDVLTPSASGFDSNFLADFSIAEDGGTYYLYYSGHNGTDYAGIGVATASSPDAGGGTFTKDSSNPILTSSSNAWDDRWVNEPHVRIRNGTFYMTYSGRDSSDSTQAIGLATSSDGVSYTKDAANPVFDPGSVNDQCHVHANGDWHLYYTRIEGSLPYPMEKVVSSDITSFGTSYGSTVIDASGDDRNWSPAIRFDSGASEYKMYWHEQVGSADSDLHIMLHTSPEIIDGDVPDFSGNANDGASQGGLTKNATGLLGTTAYSFDGMDDEVIPGSVPVLTGPPATLTVWIKSTQSAQYPEIVSNRDAADTQDILSVNTDNGAVRAVARNASGTIAVAKSTTAIDDGSWHFIAARFGSTNTEIYVDGTSEASATTPGGTYSLDDPRLGSAKGTNFYSGDMYDPRMYSVALTSAEIQTLYDVVDTSGSLITAGKTS